MIARGVAGVGDGGRGSAGRRRPGGVTMTDVLLWDAGPGSSSWSELSVFWQRPCMLAALGGKKRRGGLEAIDANHGSYCATWARLATTTIWLTITFAPPASRRSGSRGRAYRRGDRRDRRGPAGPHRRLLHPRRHFRRSYHCTIEAVRPGKPEAIPRKLEDGGRALRRPHQAPHGRGAPSRRGRGLQRGDREDGGGELFEFNAAFKAARKVHPTIRYQDYLHARKAAMLEAAARETQR
ncbi:hypothetical protein ACVWZV_009583 [Bradyrhizobium sp. GM5.1]